MGQSMLQEPPPQQPKDSSGLGWPFSSSVGRTFSSWMGEGFVDMTTMLRPLGAPVAVVRR